MSTDLLADLIADAAEQCDEIAAEHVEQYKRDLNTLLLDDTARDPELWDLVWTESNLPDLDVDDDVFLGLTMREMIDIPVGRRNLEWQQIVATQIAAAKLQAAMTCLRAVLTASTTTAKDIKRAADKVPKKELRAFAKTGPKKERFDNAKKRRSEKRNPEQRVERAG